MIFFVCQKKTNNTPKFIKQTVSPGTHSWFPNIAMVKMPGTVINGPVLKIHKPTLP